MLRDRRGLGLFCCLAALTGALGAGCGGDDDDNSGSTPVLTDRAPTVSLDAPADGIRLTIGDAVTFDGTAVDDFDSNNEIAIEWSSSVDGVLNTQGPTPDGSVGFTTSSLSLGTHTITLTAMDSGERTASAAISLTVDALANTAPSAQITDPDSGDVYVSASEISLVGQVSDNEDDDGTLAAYFSSSLSGQLESSNGGGTITWSGVLEDGEHTLTLVVEDSEGLQSVSSPITLTVLDNESPEVTFVGPDETWYNQGETVLLSAVVGDDNTVEEDLLLSWESSVEGSLPCTSVAEHSGDVACELGDLSPGLHAITLTAVDLAGALGSDTIDITINGPPSAPQITLVPEVPGTLDDLLVSFVAPSVDPDGDAITYTYSWTREGFLVSGITGDSVSNTYTARGEVWSATVVPSDGQLEGVAASASATIANTPPQLSKASVTPSTGNSSDTFTCVPSGWLDVDGDTEGYRYVWLRNGEVVAGETGVTLVPEGFKHEDTLQCQVTPFDGLDVGESVVSGAVSLDGREPSVASASVSPSTGGEETVFTCVPDGWSDPDGDDEGYLYLWFVNGVPSVETETITGESFGKSDELICEATPFDGYLTGVPVSSAGVLVVNTPPNLEGLTINPDPAYTDSVLRCVTLGYEDVDGDAEQASFRWTINGEGVSAASSPGLSDLFVRGDLIGCTAEVSDGASEPVSIKASDTTIVNKPPSITSVALNPSAGNEQTTFTAMPRGYDDADGDDAQYYYQWYVSGTASVTTASISPGSFVIGDTLRVEVTPFDGYEEGVTASSATLTVGSDENPPSIAAVVLSPEVAYETSTLTCVAEDVVDPEGDSVSLAYEWQLNGSVLVGVSGASLTGSSFNKSDEIQCFVTPSDPGLTGAIVGSNKVTILNSKPVVGSASIDPQAPTKASTLTCALSEVNDADGDEITSRFVWTVGGTAVEGATGATLSNANFDAGDAVVCAATPNDGEDDGEGVVSESVTIAGTPPTIGSVVLAPSEPFETSTLLCDAQNINDIDGDEINLKYAWYNASGQISGVTGETLTGEHFDKHDVILCRVTPVAGGESGAVVKSNSVTVLNTLPVIDSIALTPSTAYETSTLSCDVSGVADDDGDAVSLTYLWTVNASDLSVSSATLTGVNFKRGDSVLCTVTPNDGEEDGASAVSSVVTIENSQPIIGSVSLTPLEPYEDSRLECAPLDYDDADGDTVSFLYSWVINGSVLSGVGTPTLTGVYFDRGDGIFCRVTPLDDSISGDSVDSNAVVIQNSAPTIESVSLTPTLAYENSRLTCTPNGASDSDGDAITYSYSWTVNDLAVTAVSVNTLTGTYFDREDTVLCTVVANDGTSDGTALDSNPVIIENTPPQLSSATLTPTEAYEASTMTCTPGSSSDTDPDDTVALHYAWTVNGVALSSVTTTTLNGTYFDKHDDVTCIITPDDGDLLGESKESSVVTIQNTVPVVSGVSLNPSPATEADTLSCTYSGTGDDDGDGVTVSYRWTVNGSTVSGQTSSSLTSAYFQRDDEMLCWITPTDEEALDGEEIPSNGVTITNEPPTIASVSLTPTTAYETTVLTCTANGVGDLDGDTVGLSYLWTVAGSVAQGASAKTLTGDYFDRDQTVSCTVTPNDGFVDGDAVTSSSIAIQNTEPETSTPNITPTTAYVTSTLTCNASGSDDDGDTVTLAYTWEVDGATLSGRTSKTLAGDFVKGEQVLCRVTPNDGDLDGTTRSASPVTIQNTAPVTTTPTITPSTAYVTSTLSCNATGSDDDGDGVTLKYKWAVDGSTVAGQTAQTLANKFVKSNQVTCTVTPYDGSENGSAKTSSAITIQNSVPVAETPVLTPDPAYVTSSLTCNVTTSDADGDGVSVAYSWRVNSATLSGETSSILSGAFVKGDQVLCSVIPNDGTVSGTKQSSAALTIQNTAPDTTTPSLTPTTAYVTSTLTCSAAGSDDDGDGVTLGYVWKVNGSSVLSATSSTFSGAFYKDDTVTCTVTPNDGSTDGVAKTSNTVTILNSTPSTTTPTLSPTAAYVTSTLTCSASTADADGDLVSLSYVWAVAGAIVSGQTGSSLSGAFVKGNSVTCSVTPNDGSVSGTKKTSSAVTILNTVPTISTPTISPSTAYVDDVLTCSATYTDVDGDNVAFAYVWQIGGITQAGKTNATLTGVFAKGDSVSCTITPNDGEADGTAKTSSAITINNTAPSVSTPILSPSTAYVDDVLTCTATGSDADGDTVVLSYMWQLNGAAVNGQAGSTLSSGFVKGEELLCIVTPNDGSLDGAAKTSNAVIIQNSVPTITQPSITPTTAYADSTLTCNATASDTDNDTLTVAYTWKVGGITLSGQTASTLAGAFLKGDSVQCTAQPSDDQTSGTLKTSSALTIQNKAPTVSTPTITPTTVNVSSTLTCNASGSDIDNDTVGLSYAWAVGGSTLSGQAAKTLSGAFVKGNAVTCTVTPNDGTVDGDPATSAATTILNTLPAASLPVVSPSTAYADDTLSCATTTTDADNDKVTIKYQWFINGGAVNGATSITFAAAFSKTDTVACMVTPNDGEGDGDAVSSVPVVILNSAPSITTPVITPNPAYAGDTLSCGTSSSDADGDAVTLSYQWSIGGVVVGGETSATLTGGFVRDDSVACAVTPNDGEINGTSKASASVVIDNSAPSATTPSISPSTAYADDVLTCSTSVSDPDSDRVTVTYAWLLNSSVITGETAKTLSGAFSRGDVMKCRVTPSDGLALGTTLTSATVTILNTAPTVITPTITPTTAYADSTLTCSATGSDVDTGDTVVLGYTWSLNGTTIAGKTSSTLSGAFAKGESVTCTVTPDDGTVQGTAKTSSATAIQNSAPVMGTVTISPAAPDPGVALSVSGSATDADGDTLTYAYVWTTNGITNGSYTGSSIPASVTTGGETWAVSVQATDDSSAVSNTSTDSVAITNDDDGDGYVEGPDDCDDTDATIYLGATELEDGKDNDCDGIIDEGTNAYDDDGDGETENDGDCDDTDNTVYTGAAEALDSIDNDCNTYVDDRWISLFTYGASTDSFPNVASDSALALEADGLTHVYFGGTVADDSSGGTLYAYYDRGTGLPASALATSIKTSAYLDMDLYEVTGLTTEARLLTYDAAGLSVAFRSYAGTTQNTAITVNSGVDTTGLSIATDPADGTDYVAYADATGVQGSCALGFLESFLHIEARSSAGTSFSPLPDDPIATVCHTSAGIFSPSIAVDSTGLLHVAWFDAASGAAMYRLVDPAVSSGVEVSVASGTTLEAYVSLDLYSTDLPGIAYLTTSAVMLATTVNGSTFNGEIVTDSTNMGGTVPSAGRVIMDVDTVDATHIAFQAASNLELWYVTDQSGVWKPERAVTSTTSILEQHYDLAADPDGNPRVTYTDGAAKDLYLWKGKVQTTTIVY